MSGDKFDEDIDALYQHRKKSVQAPVIRLNETSVKPKRRLMEILPIFAAGSFASFAIFAVINHFAFLNPDGIISRDNHITYVDIVDVNEVAKGEEVLSMAPPAHEMKARTALIERRKKTFDMSQSKVIPSGALASVALESTGVTIISLIPEEGKVSHKPLYKVMPEYAYNDNRQAGEIKLSYQVSDKGEVTQIEVVESNVSRALEKSAKKALKQWKYTAGVSHSKIHHVEFQFKE